MNLTKSLPHDIEAEQRLVGSILFPSGGRFIEEVAAMVRGDDFVDTLLGRIFAWRVDMHRQGLPFDPVRLVRELKAAVPHEADTHAWTVARLASGVATSAHAPYYAAAVAKTASRRREVLEAVDIVHAALTERAPKRTPDHTPDHTPERMPEQLRKRLQRARNAA